MKQIIEIEVPDGYRAVYNEDTQKIEILKAKLPKTWEEFCENNHIIKKDECYINRCGEIARAIDKYRYKDIKNTLPNKETAEAFLALMQLIQLRDCYRQGWKPDWSGNIFKFSIIYGKNDIECDYSYWENRLLSFQSKEIRNEFLNNFKDLIEIAKELI